MPDTAPTAPLPPDAIIIKPWSWDRIPLTTILVTLNVIVYFFSAVTQPPTGGPDFVGFGADFAPKTLSGQWWRLITSQFVHVSAGHLIGNMLLLGLLGKRMQKILGPWTYLLFYLACGTAASLAGLAAFPFGYTVGASGGIYGLTGGIALFYGVRFSSLPQLTRWKLLLLLAISAIGFFPEVAPPRDSRGPWDYPAHIAGMAAGLALAFALRARPRGRPVPRLWIVTTTLLLLVSAAAVLRYTEAYTIPLGLAAQAEQDHRRREAESQINLALAQRPNNLKVLQQAVSIYMDADQVDEAEVFLNRALAIDSANEYTLTEQVFLYQHTDRCAAAQPIIDRLHAMHSTLIDKVALTGPCVVIEEAPPPSQ